MTVAEYISDYLSSIGIDDVFLLSGGGMMYLLDALGRNEDINIHMHHHEQHAGIAAEAYARIKGTPGVCFVTGGPGGLNAVEAIAECWVDSVPVVFIGGQSETAQTTRGSGIRGLRQYGAAEINIIPVVSSITKKAYFLTNPEDIPQVLQEAFLLAMDGRPGPVFINIPLDVQRGEFSPALPKMPSQRTVYSVASVQMNWIARQWNKAQRPLILAGQGVRIAGEAQIDSLLSLAKVRNTPIVTTQAGKDILPYDHPLFVGHAGIKGDRAGNYAVQNADFILCIGASLHVFTTGYNYEKFAPNATIIYVELDDALEARQWETIQHAFRIKSDAATFLNGIRTTRVENVGPDTWRADLVDVQKPAADVIKENHKPHPDRFNIYEAIALIQEQSREGDIIISDAGSAFYTVGQAWKLKKDQRFISPNGLGTMGWAIPAAYGAAVANPDKTVWCFVGDGSAMTALSALYAIDPAMNIKIILLDNNGYVSIRNTQNAYFEGRQVATRPQMSDWGSIAMDAGLGLVLAHKSRNIVSGYINYHGACLVHIPCTEDQEIIPTVQTVPAADGSFVPGTLDNMYPFR